MSKPVINIADIELAPLPESFAARGATAERFECRMGDIAPLIGAQKLGYNLTAVPPGKRAFPLHNHHVNEEMFFVVEGTGELRFGAETHPLRAGDIIACPPGGPETAHQIVNTGSIELRYLAISTRLSPEVCEYPDSGKYAVSHRAEGEQDDMVRLFRVIGRKELSLGYWDDE